MTPAGVPVVELSDVVVRIDGRRVLGPVSLRIEAGERWVFVGPGRAAPAVVGVGPRARPHVRPR